jgi:hypothetical protein
MNDIGNKIREKLEVTDLKTFIYVDDVMLWGNDMKEHRLRLAIGKAKVRITACR